MKTKKQEILFKNITKYTTKNYNQFIEFHNKKFSFSNILYTIIMIVLLIYCIILNIQQKELYLILMFTALLIGFLFFKIYFPMKRYQKTQNKLSKFKETGFVFSFYDLYFLIDKKPIYYLKLYKIFEIKDYFYLYLTPDYAMIVNKKGFEIGTAEEFSKFIRKKCLFKYRKQK